MGGVQGERSAQCKSIVSDERRSNPPEIGFPEGLDAFGLRLPLSSLTDFSSMLALRSLSRSKIASANCERNYNLMYLENFLREGTGDLITEEKISVSGLTRF